MARVCLLNDVALSNEHKSYNTLTKLINKFLI